MELKGIKNIIFDLGGVLLNIDYNLTQQAFIKLGAAHFDTHYTKAKQAGLFDDFETGKITEEEFCVRLQKIAKFNATHKEIILAWNAMLLDFPIIRKKLLLQLKKEFSIVLLSNTNETHVRGFAPIIKNDINQTTLNSLLHEVYYSNEIGLRKPNANAFEFVLNQNNFKASETLFIDDSIQHLEGAKKLGIKTFHITNSPVEELFANFLA